MEDSYILQQKYRCENVAEPRAQEREVVQLQVQERFQGPEPGTLLVSRHFEQQNYCLVGKYLGTDLTLHQDGGKIPGVPSLGFLDLVNLILLRL